MILPKVAAGGSLVLALLVLVPSPARGQQADPWQSGDCNRDGRIDISDAISGLLFLFEGDAEVCPPLCDLDGNGRYDIVDPIRLIGHLFRGVDLDLPPTPAVPPETCDGSDNDCDGDVDEGCPLEVSVRLSWDAVTLDIKGNPEEVAGYAVHYGTASRAYTERIPTGLRTTHTVAGLEPDVLYFFSVTAVDGAGNESDFSNEVATTGS